MYEEGVTFRLGLDGKITSLGIMVMFIGNMKVPGQPLALVGVVLLV
jgi:hypothetical protein